MLLRVVCRVRFFCSSTVSGGSLISGGSTVIVSHNSEHRLHVQDTGVLINDGLTVEGGLLTANNGLTVNGGGSISGGSTVISSSNGNHRLEVQDSGVFIENGLTVSGGLLTANSGLTVSGGTLTANSGLTVTGSTTLNGFLQGNQASFSNTLTANGGLNVQQGGLTVTEGGIRLINGNLVIQNDGAEINGGLEVNDGAEINDGLEVNDGLKVNDGAEINGGLKVEGDIQFNNDLNMNGNRITNVAEPNNDDDVATKKYVDENTPSLSQQTRTCSSNSFGDGTLSCTTASCPSGYIRTGCSSFGVLHPGSIFDHGSARPSGSSACHCSGYFAQSGGTMTCYTYCISID